jgi:signal transduction histidine kinase
MTSQIDELVQTVRRIASDLRPPLLDDFGLMAALEWQARAWEKQTGILCNLTLPPEEVMLNREQRTAVFRVFQESLTNVARHSQATQVNVSAHKEGGQLVLKVQDNGLGITSEALLPGKSLGLLGMRERMREVSGDFDIQGVAGEGTTVTIRLALT